MVWPRKAMKNSTGKRPSIFAERKGLRRQRYEVYEAALLKSASLVKLECVIQRATGEGQEEKKRAPGAKAEDEWKAKEAKAEEERGLQQQGVFAAQH